MKGTMESCAREGRLMLLAGAVRKAPYIAIRGSRSYLHTCAELGNPDWFNMETYAVRTEECGTVGCLAGWAVSLWPYQVAATSEWIGSEDVDDVAASLLLLDTYERIGLFCPPVLGLRYIQPETAAAVVEMVARGTEPDAAWRKVLLPERYML